ncbi:uncharacterized protein N7458_009736 [Penicillium daleae]|jgi:hypothetical protein|uniref:Uncharacterized protein n=1 Tax=Penicillium daleae TaxID=63821 RepID=A0AAD6BXB4_9EURO|nr:uncharacterized protein N7458_009736 [Penicillium daleae]KAJ5438738.1 hypothetical protein N7458_009736 [Penicillium daleae]
MEDTPESKIYQPGQLAQWLFFTNARGEETDPDSAIGIALEGDWERLEPHAAALLGDTSAGAYDRFLAMSALARWASPTGYEAVRAAAEDPDAQPWRGMSIDRLHSLDNTFALLTESVASSRDEAQERGTSAERLTALAALISIAHQVYFEHNISRSCLYDEDIEQLREPIETQIERGLAALGAAQTPLPQWVDDQVEELIQALRLVDENAADAYKARLGS